MPGSDACESRPECASVSHRAAAVQHGPFVILSRVGAGEGTTDRVADRIGVIYCGTCGAMNPRTNHYCSACGHQLVDAYHASEGLRVYLTPDPGAPLVEILDAGADITVVETDEELPADFVKITLEDGRLGYVRLREVEASIGEVAEAPATRREPIGCISSTALLAVIVLLLLAGVLTILLSRESDDPIAFLACVTIVPSLFVVAIFYFYVRKREEELLDERGEGRG